MKTFRDPARPVPLVGALFESVVVSGFDPKPGPSPKGGGITQNPGTLRKPSRSPNRQALIPGLLWCFQLPEGVNRGSNDPHAQSDRGLDSGVMTALVIFR